jgi:FkbH-like protein
MGDFQKSELSNKLSSISDYLNLYRKVKQQKPRKEPNRNQKIKIAFLASSTVEGIKECLTVKCYEVGLEAKIYISDYNQYAQDILDTNSGLYKFKPDLIFLFVDVLNLLGDMYFLPYAVTKKERISLKAGKEEEFKSLIEGLKKKVQCKIVLHNFEVPQYSPLGILENKEKSGIKNIIQTLNQKFRDLYLEDQQVFVYDYDNFCSSIGKNIIRDPRMYYLADMRISMEYIPALCDQYMSYIKSVKSITRKCIVLDLDNTLWGGVIGEDGLGGIKLGATPQGRPFLEFQKYLLSLFYRGIILAINSKNNYPDVKEVFEKHPDMVLKEKHFASIMINWNDKISNMKSISKELNIGTDSIVFFDDDPRNRQMIREAFPEILVVDLPDDPAYYPVSLTKLNDFNTLQITEEDRKKGKMYSEQRNREEFKKTSQNLDQYLRKLKIKLIIEKADEINIPRISQLTQKTNQFNMTTKRYLVEDIKKLIKSGSYILLLARVKDKFGDNGITGAIIIEKKVDRWIIDTFLLSCRVIGRKIENALLAYIIDAAKVSGVKFVIGVFIQSSKNAPAKDFYSSNNFKLVNRSKDRELWSYDLSNKYLTPNFIDIEVK